MTTLDPAVVRYIREQARRSERLEKRVQSVASAPADLRHAALDGAPIVYKDPQGNVIGLQGYDPGTGSMVTEYIGGQRPPVPEAPFIDEGGEVVKMQHSGLDINGLSAPANVRRAVIHVSQDPNFEPGHHSFAGYLESLDGSFTHRLPAGEWHLGVVWQSHSGLLSDMSEIVVANVEPLVNEQDIEDALETAQERLDEAKAEFEAGNEERKDEITNLNEVIIPGLREALEASQEDLEQAFSEMAERQDDFDSSMSEAVERIGNAEATLGPLPQEVQQAKDDARESREAAEAAEARAIEAMSFVSTVLQNGSFEDGLTSWTTTGGAGVIDDITRSGELAGLLPELGDSLTYGETLTATAGQVWELSGYYYCGIDPQVGITFTYYDENGAALETVSEIEMAGLVGVWNSFGPLRAEAPENSATMGFTIESVTSTGYVRVDDIALRDVTDVARLEEAAKAAADKADAAQAKADSVEQALQDKADSSELPALEQRLTDAFGEADEAITVAAAQDAQAKADAAQAAAEAEADRLAKAEAQAAQSAAEATAAADALAKADAARDAAIAASSDDATAKADAAEEAAKTAAAADALAKADAAQAEAIRQAALDATAKADAAKTDAENAAKQYADQQDVILKGEAAADAQAKADAVRAEAQEALEFYASRGDNLIFNGSFERGGEGWRTQRGEIVQTVEARTGDHALLLGRETANDYPMTDWIATEPGRVYLVEYWVKRLPGGANPRELRAYSSHRLADGSTPGGYARNDQGDIALAQVADLPEGEWVKVSGTLEIIRPTTNGVSFGPHVLATGTQFYIDDFRVVDITEAKAALDAAKAAQSKADEAHSDAGAAYNHADAAMSRAGAVEQDVARAKAQLKNLIPHGDMEGSWDETFENGVHPNSRWELVTVGDAYRGSKVLQYTHSSAVQSSAHLAPIPVTPGRIYRTRFAVRLASGEAGTGGSTSGGFGQLWRRKDMTSYNSSSHYSVWGSANFTSHLSEDWTVLEGETTAPDNMVLMRPRLYLYQDTVSVGAVVQFSALEIEDVTDLRAAEEAAKTHADNLPKVLHGTGAPAGTAPNGSIWWQHQGSTSGPVTAQWNRVNGNWVNTPIDSEAIANLDVGKLTAGSADIAEAVIQKLYTDVVAANKAEIEELIAHDLIADNADIISAAIKNLSVTERADLANVFAERLFAANAIVTHLKTRDAFVDNNLLVQNSVGAREINAESIFTDKAVANTVWAEVVRTGLLTAEEALIGGALLEKDSITVDKLTGLEEILTELLRARKIEAGDIKANAINGMTITGSTLQTRPEEGRGVKMSAANNSLTAYDNSGNETFRVSGSTGHLYATGAEVVGDLYATAPGDPGYALLGEMTTADGYRRPGLMLNTGSNSRLQPSVFAVAGGVNEAYAEDTLVLTGAEAQTNSSGRAELTLRKGGDFSLLTQWGPNNVSGISVIEGRLGLRGHLIDKTAMASDLIKIGQTTTSTERGDLAFNITLASPAPRGSHITTATPFSAHSSAFRAAKVAVTISSASNFRFIVADRTTGGTWSIYYHAIRNA